MTAERLEEIREHRRVASRGWRLEEIDTMPLFGMVDELLSALDTERARLDAVLLGMRRGTIVFENSNLVGYLFEEGKHHGWWVNVEGVFVETGEDGRAAIDAAREREKGAAR